VTSAGPLAHDIVKSAKPIQRRSLSGRIPWKLAFLLSFPALAGIVVVYLVPFAGTIRLSFSQWVGIGRVTPVGTANYRSLFADPTFYASVRITLLFAVVVTVVVMVLATVTAIAVRRGRVATLLRVIWFLPAIAPGTAIAVSWGFAFQPISGAVNGILGDIGLGSGHAWLASASQARWAVMGVAVWAGVAFPFLVIVGAIARISPDLYEAAQLDGAPPWKQAWRITIPMIQPVLVILAALELIWNFNSFTLIWAMTRGGPVSSTSILPVRLYTTAFQQYDFGGASAIGVLASVVLVVAGLIGLRFANSRSDVN
jgi:ABC-type sugar transport system permease subunit